MSFTKVEATSEMCTIPDFAFGQRNKCTKLGDAGYLASTIAPTAKSI